MSPPALLDSRSVTTFPQPTTAQLRHGLHALVVILALVVLVRAVALDEEHLAAIGALVIAFVAAYLARVRWPAHGGLLLLAAVGTWVGLVLLGADAAYLSVGLVLVFMTEFDLVPAVLAVVGLTALDVLVGLSRGGGTTALVAPVLGGVLAGLFGTGYRVLFDAVEELRRTRSELADSERAAGQATERERLAREIHDTVAQGLSSIQMLLGAVEEEPLPDTARGHVSLARTTAAAGLADARRMVAELAPADLEESSLVAALQRISDRSPAQVALQVDGEAVDLPMPVEAALVRIAQGALANVEQHAGPRASAVVTLGFTATHVHLDVVDDGVGFDTDAPDPAGGFGLPSMRGRVADLGGRLDIESQPGHTAVAVSFPHHRTGVRVEP